MARKKPRFKRPGSDLPRSRSKRLGRWMIGLAVTIGVVLVVGAVKNWNWLCSPIGKPDGHRLSRGMYRLIFGALGLILIVCELMVLF